MASNTGGDTPSDNASVQLLAPQKLGLPVLQPDGTLTLLSRNADGSLLTPGDLSGFAALTSTNLLDWTPLAGALSITNGGLLLVDPAAAGYSDRFYRILQR
jgi:hypothetical protein